MKRKLFLAEKNRIKKFFLKKGLVSVMGCFVFFLFLISSSGNAMAIPSYARQTGLSCSKQ